MPEICSIRRGEADDLTSAKAEQEDVSFREGDAYYPSLRCLPHLANERPCTRHTIYLRQLSTVDPGLLGSILRTRRVVTDVEGDSAPTTDNSMPNHHQAMAGGGDVCGAEEAEKSAAWGDRLAPGRRTEEGEIGPALVGRGRSAKKRCQDAPADSGRCSRQRTGEKVFREKKRARIRDRGLAFK